MDTRTDWRSQRKPFSSSPGLNVDPAGTVSPSVVG